TVATVEPMRTGKPVGDLSPVLGPAALSRLTGTDRAVLVDEGLPRVRGVLTVTGQPVNVVGLGDQAGNVPLVSATIDLTAQGVTGPRKTTVTVTRKGSLVLAADPSGWKIIEYDLEVARSGSALDTPTTTTTNARPTSTPATTRR